MQVDVEVLCLMVDYVVGQLSLVWLNRSFGNVHGVILPGRSPLLAYNISNLDQSERANAPDLHEMLCCIRWLVLSLACLLRAILGFEPHRKGTCHVLPM